MEVLANPQVLPLLMALVGPTIHIAESGARTCIAPPRERAEREGGYTSWVRREPTCTNALICLR